MSDAVVQGEARFSNDPDPERYFRTSHLMSDLKGRSVRGGAITVGSRAGKFALRLIYTAVLARLLTTADFGLVIMVTVITGFVEKFKDAGLSMATVQRSEVNHAQISTLFWINLALGCALTTLIAAASPLVAWFYNEPRLIGITIALSFTFIFGGLTIQHQALLRRQMRYMALGLMQVIAMAVGVIAAIVMGVMGFGYWALIGLSGGQVITSAAMVWILCPWRPGLPRRNSGVGSMLAFGGNLSASNFITYFGRNADAILIGWCWGASPLAIYKKAYELLMLPIRQMNTPLGAVALPGLSRVQDDPKRYRGFFRKAIFPGIFVGIPLLAFLAVDAREVVLIVLGHQWVTMVPIFRWLVPAAMIGTLNVARGWVFQSLDQTNRQFRWSLLEVPLLIVAFGVGLNWGPLGVAMAYSLIVVLLKPIGLWYAFRYAPVTMRDLGKVLWRPALATAIATAVCIVTKYFLFSPDSHFLACALDLLVFASAYTLTWLVSPAGRAELAGLYDQLSSALLKRPSRENTAAENAVE